MSGFRRVGWLLALVTATTAGPAFAAGAPNPRGDDRRLSEAVAAIVRADYRGDRAALLNEAQALAGVPLERHEKYREYWVGFAYWRRGINGFNETPQPPDLRADFDRCAAHEQAALSLDPAFDDARGALVGCLIGQFSTGELTPEQRAALTVQATDAMKAVRQSAEGNPRSLWMVGGSQVYKGDVAGATATFRRGLAAARAEALAGPRDPWVPVWGGAENLMSLAYLYTRGPAPNRALALAYAESALAMVPDWHFVRDILLPQAEKLGEAKGTDGPAPGGSSGPPSSRSGA